MSYILNKETVAVMYPRILMCKVGNRKKGFSDKDVLYCDIWSFCKIDLAAQNKKCWKKTKKNPPNFNPPCNSDRF